MSQAAKKNKRSFRSVDEFEKTYFPEAFKKKEIKGLVDARAIGASMAKEAFEEIRKKHIG